MLHLYDTAAREVRELALREPGTVSIYLCGPTVYGPPHLGHGRATLVYDVLRRYLEWSGLTVRLASNITDIDDKIIERANREGRPWQDITTKCEAVWFEAMDKLGVQRPTDVPHATAYVEQMVIDAGPAHWPGTAEFGGWGNVVLAGHRSSHTEPFLRNAELAAKVQSGELTYTQAVAQGMYTPLGTGDAEIAGVVNHLLDQGFDGWFTLEQDTILEDAPTGEGPVSDVRTSADNLRDVLRQARVQEAVSRAGTAPVARVLFTDPGAPPEVPPLYAMEFRAGSSFEPLLDECDVLPAPAVLRARAQHRGGDRA